MIINSRIFLICGVLFLTYCSPGQKNWSDTTLDIDRKGVDTLQFHVVNRKPLKMSTIFSEIEYLPLETKDNYLIGRIEKIIVEHGKIFILESGTPSVIIFRLDGTLINQIPIPEGKGPGQLLDLEDFVVHPQEQQFSVLGPLRLNTFNFSGKVINELTFKVVPSSIGLLPNGNYILYMDNYNFESEQFTRTGNNILYMNQEGEITDQALPIKTNRSMLGYSVFNNFPKYKDKQLFFGHPDYNVYELTADSIKIRYYLDFGNHKVPENMFENRTQFNDGIAFQKKILNEGYASLISNFRELDDLFYFKFRTNSQSFFSAFYLKKKDRAIVANELVNDIDKGIEPSLFISKHKDWLIAIKQPSDLIQKAQEIKQRLSKEELEQYRQLKTNLIDLTDGMSAMDNPVLMLCKVK